MNIPARKGRPDASVVPLIRDNDTFNPHKNTIQRPTGMNSDISRKSYPESFLSLFMESGRPSDSAAVVSVSLE